MRSIATLGAAASLALTCHAAAATAAKPAAKAVARPASASARAELEALERTYNAGFNAKDVAKVMSVYAREGLFVFDVTPPREHASWASYDKDWHDLFAAFPGPLSNTISEQSLSVAGDTAWGHNVQTTHMTRADGTKDEVVVRVSDVYRKTGGRWRIVQEHVSVPVDLGTGKADLMSRP